MAPQRFKALVCLLSSCSAPKCASVGSGDGSDLASNDFRPLPGSGHPRGGGKVLGHSSSGGGQMSKLPVSFDTYAQIVLAFIDPEHPERWEEGVIEAEEFLRYLNPCFHLFTGHPVASEPWPYAKAVCE